MFPEDTKILICDDSKIARRLLKLELITSNFKNIQEAESGAEALEIIQVSLDKPGQRVELLFLDIVMPGISGVDLVKILKEIDPILVIIMASAESDRVTVMQTLKNGANNYIVKPYDRGQVLEKMKCTWEKLKNPPPQA